MTPNIFKPAEDFAHDALIDSYARLSIQSAMFGHVPANMCAVFRDPKTNALPYSFDSVSEARQTLDDLLNRNHCLKRHSDTVREKEIKGDRREVANTQKAILEDLTLWRKAFDNSLPRFVNKGRSGKFGHQLLVVNFEMAMIMAATCLSKDEMIFDQYTERILTIVTTFVNMWNFFATLDIKIKDLRKTLDDPTQACAGNGFTAECGFIPPIYYTTLKCRDPRIRRQSIVIVILRSVPHREGVWNGLLLADVAEQVMWMEEDGVYDGDPTVDDRIAVQDPPARDLPLPEIKRSMRVSDVGVVLADMVDGHTFVTYKKLQGGHWKHFSRVLQPCWLSKGSPSGSFSSTGLPLSPAS
ncbi:uncharacterized protein N7473_005107 [Penicillium subrubescens]|uniref:uncharacterized protein n=1 Tax=Penicillium subrubescens TaxID=1316194 RepID=UPI00254546C1|nr:uncharacterized protein N7473_005107 [Penicillium subrubescens]KAJ5895708.1 hypothetical protein N7473_005107 [Penicillium subrubescens]